MLVYIRKESLCHTSRILDKFVILVLFLMIMLVVNYYVIRFSFSIDKKYIAKTEVTLGALHS